MNVFLVLALNVGLAAVIYLLLMRRIDRKLEPGRIVDNIRSEIEGIIVELNQTTDRNIGLIEDRVSGLKSLLDQADKRLSVLKREVQSQAGATERYNDIVRRSGRQTTGSRKSTAETAGTAGENSGAAGNKAAGSEAGGSEAAESGAGSKTEKGVQRAESGQSAEATNSSNATTGSSDDGPSTKAAESKSGGRAVKRREIVELHRKGIASNIIANRTGTTIGEVELIISLNDRKE